MHRGCFVSTPTPPLAGRRTPRPGPVRVYVCVLSLAGSGGPASRARFDAPHLFLWLLCPSPLLGLLWSGVAPVLVLLLLPCCFFLFFFLVCPFFFALCPLCLLPFLVAGPGCLGPWRFALFVLLASRFLALRALLLSLCCLPEGRSQVVAPPPLLFRALPLSLAFSGLRPVVPWALVLCFVCFSRPLAARLSVRSRLACVSCLAVGCPLVVAPPPPGLPLLCCAVSVAPARCLGFFFLPLCAPVVSGFHWFPAPGALGLGAVRCLLCWPAASRLSVRSCLFRAFRLAVGCSLVVAPPPLCVSRFSSLPLGAVCRVLCCAVCPWVRCCAQLLRVVPPGVVLSGAVLLCCASLVPLLVAPCPLALPVALGPRAVCCVLRVFCRGVVVRAVVCRSALCCVCPGVLCCAFSVLSARCGAVLCCAGALASCCSSGACCCWRRMLWCAAVFCAVFFWCAVVRCWVWLPVVVCWWRVSVSVSLSGRVVCFPVVGVVCCGALLPCVVFCGAVLSRGAVLLCSAVVLWCCWGLLCPPVACAVLCCWLAVLFFARWWCLRAVVLFPSCSAFTVFSALCAAVPCCAGCGAWLPCVVCCGAVPSCGAVLSCSAVVLRCCLCVLCPPLALCGAVLCCVVLLVVCAVFCPVVAFVCCGALSLPAGTHKKHQLSYVSPRVGGGVMAGMPWWLRCPGLDAAHVPPAAKGRRKCRRWGTGGRRRYMAKRRGREGPVQGRSVLGKFFLRVLRVARDAVFFTWTAY